MSTRLTSLNKVKIFLRIPITETGIDAFLAPILEAKSKQCETICGRIFAQQTVVDEPYDGGGEALCLKNFPVDPDANFRLKVTAFYATIENGFYNTIYLPETQFNVDFVTGILSLQAGLRFPTERNSIFCSYTGGYSVTGDLSAPDGLTQVNVPDDLQRAVMMATAAEWRFQQNVIDLDTLEKHEEYTQKNYASYVRTS